MARFKFSNLKYMSYRHHAVLFLGCLFIFYEYDIKRAPPFHQLTRYDGQLGEIITSPHSSSRLRGTGAVFTLKNNDIHFYYHPHSAKTSLIRQVLAHRESTLTLWVTAVDDDEDNRGKKIRTIYQLGQNGHIVASYNEIVFTQKKIKKSNKLIGVTAIIWWLLIGGFNIRHRWIN